MNGKASIRGKRNKWSKNDGMEKTIYCKFPIKPTQASIMNKC